MKDSRMTKVNFDEMYRSVEFVFDTNIEAVMTSIIKQAKTTFLENGFKHATLVVDIRNPSKSNI